LLSCRPPLSAQLGRSVLVDDASLRLVAYSPTYGTEDEVRRTAILTRETPRVIRDIHFSQGIATASRPVRTAAKPELGLQSRVCVPIRCQGALSCLALDCLGQLGRIDFCDRHR
jgi:hypothetical protein